jgi:hypothetical protein
VNGLLGLVVLGSSIWMAVDASQLGYDKRDVKGLAAMGPAGWLLAGLLLWIVAFPLYLIKRPELKAAGERRRQWALGGGGPPALPGQVPYGQPPYGQPPYGQPPQYGPPQYGQPQYGQPQYGQPQYGQPQYGQPPAQPPGYGPPSSPDAVRPDVVEAITKLAQLRDRGLLTDAEFQLKKSELLARS